MPEFPQALEIMRRLNRFVAGDSYLKKVLMEGEFNYWHLQQSSTFFILRAYVREGEPVLAEFRKSNFSIKYLVAGFVAMLISLFSWIFLTLSKRRVIVFSIDKISSRYKSDFRISGIYKYLGEKGIPFVEFFHTSLSREFITNFVRRERPAIYLEGISFLFDLVRWFGLGDRREERSFDTSSFGKDSKIAKLVIDRAIDSISASRFKIKLIKWLLKPTAVHVLLTIDHPRHYGELVAACQMNEIPVYAFQHARFTKYQVPWIDTGSGGNVVRPNYLVVWSEYWKNELLRLGTYFKPEEIVVGGDPKGTGPVFTSERSGGERLRVLMPFETDIPVEEAKEYVKKIVNSPGLKLVLKTRPDRSQTYQLAQYGLRAEDDIEVLQEITKETKVDAAVGVHSTFLYDVIRHNIPVGIFETSSDYARGMIENGLADSLQKEEDIQGAISRLSGTPREVLEERRNKLYGETPLSISVVLSEIGDTTSAW